MDDSTFIIEHPSELSSYEFVPSNSILQDTSYQQAYSRTKQYLLNQSLIQYRDYQAQASAVLSSIPKNIINGSMGIGKSQPITCYVYTPDGPKLIGDLQPGDSVFTPTSTSKVLSTHPQGSIDFYKITFSDNSYTYCSLNHLWSIIPSSTKPSCIMTTEEIIQHVSNRKNPPLHIPLTLAVPFPSKLIPIPAYHLGCLLDNPDSFRTLCHSIDSLYNSLHSLGINLSRPSSFFIPKIYLFNSVDVRLNLLQGLLDSNSSFTIVNKNIECINYYVNSSGSLAKDIQFLIESLGGTCLIEKKGKKTANGASSIYFQLSINLPRNICPFKNPLKLADYPMNNFYKVYPYQKNSETSITYASRAIKKVDYAGQTECVCIKLENEEGLYLTDRFIVTHNTIICLLAIQDIFNNFEGSPAPGSVHILVPSLLSSNRWLEDSSFFPFKHSFHLLTPKSFSHSLSSPIFLYTHDFLKLIHRLSSSNYISLLKWLYPPQMTIIDEVHHCQYNSKRTHHISSLIKDCPRVIAMSGTITEGRLADVHYLCSLIYGSYWPFSNPSSFCSTFGSSSSLNLNYLADSNSPKTKIFNHLNPSKSIPFKNLCDHYIYRINLSDPYVSSSITLPSPSLSVIGIQPSDVQLLLHKQYVEGQYNKIKEVVDGVEAEGVETVKTKAEALRLIYPLIQVSNHCDDNKHNNKLMKVVELVKESKGKVVIFCAYNKSGNIVSTRLKEELGSSAVVRLYSKDDSEQIKKLSDSQRMVVVDRFLHDPEVKVGVFSIKLAGESINLTSANSIIYYCLPWSIKTLSQSIYRVIRPGNPHSSVNIYLLFNQGLIDEYQVALTQTKLKFKQTTEEFRVDTFVDDTSSYTPSNVLKQLLS